MLRFKVLSVPLDFSDANFCPLNSGPLDLNRLKIMDDILNRVGKIPAFMSKVHAGGIYRYLPAFTGIYRRSLEFTGIY